MTRILRITGLLVAAFASASASAQSQYQIIEIAQQGNTGVTGEYVDFGLPSINDIGHVGFRATVSYGPDNTETVIFRHDGFTPTDAEPLYSSAAPNTDNCAVSAGAICTSLWFAETVIINNSDDIAFSVRPVAQTGDATDIVVGDGFAVPDPIIGNAENNGDSFTFYETDPLLYGDFNHNGYAVAAMGSICSGAVGGRSVLGNGSLLAKTIGNPASTIPPGIVIGEPCDVGSPNPYAFGNAIDSDSQTVIGFGGDPAMFDPDTSPGGVGLYRARPFVNSTLTRLAPIYDSNGQHVDVNSSGIAVYTDDKTAGSQNLEATQPLNMIDTSNPSAGTTELLVAGASHPEFAWIQNVAITDSGQVFVFADPHVGNLALYEIDPATGDYTPVELLNRQVGGSTIFRVNWARAGVNSSGEITARVQLFSGEWAIIKATPESALPQIQVYDPDNPIGDRQTYLGFPDVGNTSQAVFRVENGANGNLSISGVGVNDTLAAPFAISQDGCTGAVLNGTDANTNNDSCEITVTFTPSTSGEFADTFDILSNDPAEPSITLTVTGGQAPSAGEFAFEVPTYSVFEGDGDLTVNVARRNGSAGAVSVDYTTQDQEALGGADYTTTSGTLDFPDGVTQQSITIPIIDDQDIENAETFLVTLSNPTGGATLGTTPSATVTINASDIPQPDLNISGLAEARAELSGDAFVDYAITVSNEGLADASNVSVSLNFSAGELAWDSDDSSGSYATGTSTWSIGGLPANESRTLMITFLALVDATIELTASASTDDAEPVPDPNPNAITFSTAVGPDTDADGVFDLDDNAPGFYNPDQSDIDGDGVGDVIDVCPADATDSCDPLRSAGANINETGGVLETADGAVSMTIPAGALPGDTSMSITDLGANFELTTNSGTTNAIFGVNIGPDGTTFAAPVTIVLTWPDADNDGTVDGTTIAESTLQVFKDGAPITDTCDVDAGCDATANTFSVEVTSLSDFVIGAVAATPPPPPQNSGGGGGGAGSPGLLGILAVALGLRRRRNLQRC